MIKSQKVIFQKLHKLLTERALSELHGGSLFRTFNILAIHSISISQFIISEGAWNCGRKSGVSMVNCEKFESVTVRAPRICLLHAIYTVRDCTTNNDSKRIASRRHWYD